MFKTFVTADLQDGMSDWSVFAPSYFDFINRHPRVKAFSYISADWATIPPWQSWGNATLQDNPYILGQWIAELSQPHYLSDLFSNDPFPWPWMNHAVQRVGASGFITVGAHNCHPGDTAFLLVAPALASAPQKVPGIDGTYDLAGAPIVFGPILADGSGKAEIAGQLPADVAGGVAIHVQTVVLNTSGLASGDSITAPARILIE